MREDAGDIIPSVVPWVKTEQRSSESSAGAMGTKNKSKELRLTFKLLNRDDIDMDFDRLFKGISHFLRE